MPRSAGAARRPWEPKAARAVPCSLDSVGPAGSQRPLSSLGPAVPQWPLGSMERHRVTMVPLVPPALQGHNGPWVPRGHAGSLWSPEEGQHRAPGFQGQMRHSHQRPRPATSVCPGRFVWEQPLDIGNLGGGIPVLAMVTLLSNTVLCSLHELWRALGQRESSCVTSVRH